MHPVQQIGIEVLAQGSGRGLEIRGLHIPLCRNAVTVKYQIVPDRLILCAVIYPAIARPTAHHETVFGRVVDEGGTVLNQRPRQRPSCQFQIIRSRGRRHSPETSAVAVLEVTCVGVVASVPKRYGVYRSQLTLCFCPTEMRCCCRDVNRPYRAICHQRLRGCASGLDETS